MNTISKDVLSIVVDYLEYEDIVNLKQSNESFDRMMKDMPIFINKQRNNFFVLDDVLFKLIFININLNKKSEYEIFLKINNKSLSQILNFLYYDIFAGNLTQESKKYSNTFYSMDKILKEQKGSILCDILQDERKNFIMKELNTDEIVITNQRLKIVFDITFHFNWRSFENFIKNILVEKKGLKNKKEILKRKTYEELQEMCQSRKILEYINCEKKYQLINLLYYKSKNNLSTVNSFVG
jgi:hypothetical protein